MPLYEYECTKCGEKIEVIRSFFDPPLTVCPNCGGVLVKLLSSPAFQFKGSGFYLTDYGKSGSSQAGEKEKRSAGKAEERKSSSESKGEEGKGSSASTGAESSGGGASDSSKGKTGSSDAAPSSPAGSSSPAPSKKKKSDSK
jgi:putative FmdB family regulatory protein